MLVLVACGGPRPVATAPPLANQGSAAIGEVRLPAIYAGLFVAAAKTFPAELVVSHTDVTGPVTDRQVGEVTCTIDDVQTIRGGKIAELACDGIEMANLVSGTYVGTATGLWRVDGSFEGDITKLDREQVLLGATPAKAHTEHKDADSGIDSGSAILVEPHAGGWCVLVMSWGGDEGGWQLCLKEGSGVIGGHGFFAGGESRDAYFGDVRRL